LAENGTVPTTQNLSGACPQVARGNLGLSHFRKVSTPSAESSKTGDGSVGVGSSVAWNVPTDSRTTICSEAVLRRVFDEA